MTDSTIKYLISWAKQRENIRAVLLTSTRTRPDAVTDRFSDYDVILAVEDIYPFYRDRSWLQDFGPVLAVYRDPIRVEYGCERFAFITQYEQDQLKIDFTIMQSAWLSHAAKAQTLPDELDVGYLVLLDKDALTDNLKAPSHQAYILVPPTEDAYLELVEVFFHEATYVAKHLWRGELLPAKYSLDQVMKLEKLRKMLEWLVGIEHNWSIKAGAHGKGLKKYVPSDIWSDLEMTYVGAGIAENWEAMLKTIDLFRRVAIRVGESLGYAYPYELDQRVTIYLDRIKNMDRE